MSSLRDELGAQKSSISSLRDEVQRLRLAHERSQQEADRLRTESEARSEELKRQAILIEQQEQAKRDLRGLEETVARELHTLHQLRKLFVQELQLRVKKVQPIDIYNFFRITLVNYVYANFRPATNWVGSCHF